MTAPFALELSQTSRQRGFVRERRGAASFPGAARDTLWVQRLTLEGDEAARVLAGLGDDVARLAQMDPAGIVTVVEHGQTDGGAPFVVTRDVDAPTLAARLSEGPLDLDPGLDLALGLARTLADAHTHGLTHGAIRPEAIRMSGAPKLGDWGLGAAMPVAARSSAQVLRTVAHYFSPEQARGDTWGAPSDCFQWASTVYEALTGERAFAAASPIGTLTQLAHGRAPIAAALDGLPTELAELLRACWSGSPDARPSAAALVATLAELIGETDAMGVSEPLLPCAEPIDWDDSPFDSRTEPQRELPNHIDEDALPTLAYSRRPDDDMPTLRDQRSDAIAALLDARRDEPITWPPPAPMRTLRLDAPTPRSARRRPPLPTRRFPEALTWAAVACGAASAVTATTLLAIWLTL